MYGFTKGKEKFDNFTKHFDRACAVATDGAPAIVGQYHGFVTLAEEKIGHPVMKLHCIIYQENLCAKISNSAFKDVMSTVWKIVNFLVARCATTHRVSLFAKTDGDHMP